VRHCAHPSPMVPTSFSWSRCEPEFKPQTNVKMYAPETGVRLPRRGLHRHTVAWHCQCGTLKMEPEGSGPRPQAAAAPLAPAGSLRHLSGALTGSPALGPGPARRGARPASLGREGLAAGGSGSVRMPAPAAAAHHDHSVAHPRFVNLECWEPSARRLAMLGDVCFESGLL
jgi:hypothetical protein